MTAENGFARKLGLFDASMIVMGGIIGSGIFINSYVVAQRVHTPALILGVWLIGGIVALIGAFVYAELASARPAVGGQYAYIREAYHPAAAFAYGWALLLVIQTGGMAAVAITFAKYLNALVQTGIPDWLIAISTLAILTCINCLGVKPGAMVQNILMILKILAIATLVICGFSMTSSAHLSLSPVIDQPFSFDLLRTIGAAMIPVLFAYGGWQTSNFIAGEIREPEKNLPRGLILGVCGVIALYLLVNLVYVGALGTEGLPQTSTPASQVMRLALGEFGARFIAIGIAISTLGFLSQSILTGPRVYYAMAKDGLFFKSVAWLHPKTQVPMVAIVVQGILAIIVALSGKYEQILNYVVSQDFIFFGLSATCIFVFRKRGISGSYRTWGHPFTTLFFVAVCWLVVADTFYSYPGNTLIGLGIMLAGIPVFFYWRRKNRASVPNEKEGPPLPPPSKRRGFKKSCLG
jgi:APA family basic amino acid/polyamine antiporter